MIVKFRRDKLKELWIPKKDSYGEDNGQVTIIGGSKLFHGAPMLAVKAASRLVDMVFFGSPERDLSKVAKINSFVWVPWEEVEEYIKKSDAILIGPGFMRFRSEKTTDEQRRLECDEECQKSKEITKRLLGKFPDKQWVIDGGSLQTMEVGWIPKNSILTPNRKEFGMLFGTSPLSFPSPNLGEGLGERYIEEIARKHSCLIVVKEVVSYITDGETTYEIAGGNAGLTKGGTGDVLAGLTVGLAAKNPPLLAAAAAIWLIKKTSDILFEKVGYAYNADDLADAIFGTYRRFVVD